MIRDTSPMWCHGFKGHVGRLWKLFETWHPNSNTPWEVIWKVPWFGFKGAIENGEKGGEKEVQKECLMLAELLFSGYAAIFNVHCKDALGKVNYMLFQPQLGSYLIAINFHLRHDAN